MVKEVIHDPIFLGVKSEVATKEDLQVAHTAWINMIACSMAMVGGRMSNLPKKSSNTLNDKSIKSLLM